MATSVQIPLDDSPEALEPFSANLMISDVLTVQNSASIFYSYARETSLSEVFGRADSRVTVFAPSNKAVMALARKP